MLDRIAEFFVFGFFPLLVGVMAGPPASMAADRVIEGEVVYREKTALPPDAVLTVQLADVSLADAPGTIVAEQKVDPAGQAPIGFKLSFDPAALLPNMTYVLQARIMSGNALLFINDERHAIDPLTDARQTLVVRMIGAKDQTAPDAVLGKDWTVAFVDGAGDLPDTTVTFRIDETGKVGGKGPCNSYFSQAKVEGSSMTLGPVGATRMACSQDQMARETALFDALAKVAAFRIDGGRLILADRDGKEVVRLAAAG